MARVFLSYAREDSDVRDFLRGQLVGSGIDVFVDSTLVPGTPAWSEELERRVESSDALVVVMTPSSKRSQWVRNECSYAVVHNVPIVPLLARGVESDAVPMELVRYHRIDLTANPTIGVQQLVVRLRGGLSPSHSAVGLQLRTYEFVQVSKYPTPSWRWSAWINAPASVQHDANKAVLGQMGAKRIGDVRVKKKDSALFRASGSFSSLVGPTVVIHAAVFPTPMPGVHATVALATTESMVLGRDQVRERTQQFAFTTAGLVTAAGGLAVSS